MGGSAGKLAGSGRPGRTPARRPAWLPDRSLARNTELAGLSARMGGAYAANRARRVFASAERRAELD